MTTWEAKGPDNNTVWIALREEIREMRNWWPGPNVPTPFRLPAAGNSMENGSRKGNPLVKRRDGSNARSSRVGMLGKYYWLHSDRFFTRVTYKREPQRLDKSAFSLWTMAYGGAGLLEWKLGSILESSFVRGPYINQSKTRQFDLYVCTQRANSVFITSLS